MSHPSGPLFRALLLSALWATSGCGLCGAKEYAKHDSPDGRLVVRLFSAGCGQESSELATMTESVSGSVTRLIDTRNAGTLNAHWKSDRELELVLVGMRQATAERELAGAARSISGVRVRYFVKNAGTLTEVP
jgi:hypothetical protein